MENKMGCFKVAVLLLPLLFLALTSPGYGDVLTPTQIIQNPGANNLDNFGYSVIDGADLDNDSVTDFVMCGFYWGSSGQNKQGDCRAFSGADLTELFSFGSPTPQSFNVTAGFLDVDGSLDLVGKTYIDVIMGGDLKDNGKTPAVGIAYVFFLGPDRKGNLGIINYQTIESPEQVAGARFGHSMAVFNSSDPRVVIGAPGLNRAYVYRVQGGQLVPDEAVPEISGSGGFGYAMAAVDNYLVVGAPGNNSIHVYDAASGFMLVDSRAGEWAGFGRTVTALGDVDNNGSGDFAVGNNDGMAYPAGTIELFDIMDVNGDALLTLSGNRITSVGNWDCDEYLDLLVGSSVFNAPAQAYLTGPLSIVSGYDGSTLDVLDNGSNDDADGLGYAFALGGNLADGNGNKDGLPDIVVGAPGALDNRGEAYAFAGRPEQVDSDHDGVPDGCDTCQGQPDGEDTDGDGLSWPCDPCPDDPADECLDDLTVTIEVDAGTHILEPGTVIPATTTLTNDHAGDVQVVGPTCPGLSYRFYLCNDPLQEILPPLYLLGESLGQNSVIDLNTGSSVSTICNILDYLHPETIAALTSNGVATSLCGEVCYSSYAPFECLDDEAPGGNCFQNLWQGGTVCDDFTLGLVNPLEVSMEVKPNATFDPFVIPTINLGLNGNVPIVILGSDDLDVRLVDPLSVYMESGSFLRGTNGGDQYSYDDKNGDGFEDLVLHMDIEAYMPANQVKVTLYAKASGNLFVVGYDDVRILDK